MEKIETLDMPVIKHSVNISKKLKNKLLSKTEPESQVIVHCNFKSNKDILGIKIFKSTYLRPGDSKRKCKLLHVENIAVAPQMTEVRKGITKHFTLIFSALPKSCKVFDLSEEVNDPYKFVVRNIPRNKSDVYTININF